MAKSNAHDELQEGGANIKDVRTHGAGDIYV